VLNILRSPKLGFALINHTTDDIYDYGTVHEGADVVVLEEPSEAEAILARDLLPGGYLVEVGAEAIVVEQDGEEVERTALAAGDDKDAVLLTVLGGRLEELVTKYE
jgi:hypothetical protein